MFLPTLPAKTFLLVLLVCLNTACPSSKPSQEEVESQKQEQQNLPGEGGGDYRSRQSSSSEARARASSERACVQSSAGAGTAAGCSSK
jgi:hypothetical protein